MSHGSHLATRCRCKHSARLGTYRHQWPSLMATVYTPVNCFSLRFTRNTLVSHSPELYKWYTKEALPCYTHKKIQMYWRFVPFTDWADRQTNMQTNILPLTRSCKVHGRFTGNISHVSSHPCMQALSISIPPDCWPMSYNWNIVVRNQKEIK